MKKICEKTLYKGNWLEIKEQEFITDKNIKVLWESINRKHTRKILVIIAKLKPSNQYVIIKQFRPSINNYVLGFPAGLSESDDLEKDALKELQEETGYTGKITSISPKLAFNPAMTNETVNIVCAEINENNPINSNPKQSLEADEEIEVLLVGESNVKNLLLKEKESGTDIGIALWYLFGVEHKF